MKAAFQSDLAWVKEKKGQGRSETEGRYSDNLKSSGPVEVLEESTFDLRMQDQFKEVSRISLS